MNPANCPRRDWSLYYNHTYMLHNEQGVVFIMVGDDGNLFYRKTRNKWTKCDPEAVECLWPSPRALNYGNGRAIYIGRRGVRSARRSAHSDAYYPVWTDGLRLDRVLMNHLCFPPEYPSLDFALKAIIGREWSSVAISRDLLLANLRKDTFEVICCGQYAGAAQAEDGRVRMVEPEVITGAYKRACFKLAKEGFAWL